MRDGEVWRPLREVRHNLPAERDAFVGRGAELRALAAAARRRRAARHRRSARAAPARRGSSRRYARGLARRLAGRGVVLRPVARRARLDGICSAPSRPRSACRSARDDPVVQLGHAIAGRGRCLVILDNFEQVVGHARGDGRPRGSTAPARRAFVVTSRERLRARRRGSCLPLEPLPLAGEAIELFAARARGATAGFALRRRRTATPWPRSCACSTACRSRSSSPRRASGCCRRRRSSSGCATASGCWPARAAPRRARRTLRAAIDWSWDLLAPWEQAAFAQCSVFEGGFTLEAAEAVLDLAALARGAAGRWTWCRRWSTRACSASGVRGGRGRCDIDEPRLRHVRRASTSTRAERLARRSARAERRRRPPRRAATRRFGSDAALEALDGAGGGAARAACARARARQPRRRLPARRRVAATGRPRRGPAARPGK